MRKGEHRCERISGADLEEVVRSRGVARARGGKGVQDVGQRARVQAYGVEHLREIGHRLARLRVRRTRREHEAGERKL